MLKMAGFLALVFGLIILIKCLEPENQGISRAQAAKAAALFAVSREECLAYQDEEKESHFSKKEKNNWYVMYMDYLYYRGGLNEEYTKSTAESANQEMTYQEAKCLAEFLGESYGKKISVNRNNKTRPYPAELWWQIYEEAAREQEGLEIFDVVLYGTPANVENGEKWTCYTDKGSFGFEGLALDTYIDRKIRIFVRDGEIAGVSCLLSEEAEYKNVWLSETENHQIRAYLGNISRKFSFPEDEDISEDFSCHIADLFLEKGKLVKITLKKERVRGKVLAVGEKSIEIEGYGELELDESFRVYKVYGEYREEKKSNILVGYDLQEFVVADKKLCAALIIQPFNGERIRVLLMDNGFQSLFHAKVSITVNSDTLLSFGEKEEKQQILSAGSQITFEPGNPYLQEGRVLLTPSAEENGIQIDSLTRGHGVPVYNGMLEIQQEKDGLILVNDLLLEDYLKKVVPSEMPASYEMEALKAQAVCARTYAYKQVIDNSYSRYGAHVDDSTNYQVYNNVAVNSRTNLAVDETCGKLLFYQGNPIDAYYYSTSCGHGSDGSVWGAESSSVPYLKACELRKRKKTLDLYSNAAFAEFIKNPDIPAYDASFAMYRWNALYKGSTLGNKLGMNWISSIEVTQRGPGGIVKELVITDIDGEKRICKDQMEVRRALGSKELSIERKNANPVDGWTLLPSAFIAVEQVGTAKDGSCLFQIYGGGYGHGAGMSQNGAQGMAKEGKSYKEILNFFYEGTEILDCSWNSGE